MDEFDEESKYRKSVVNKISINDIHTWNNFKNYDNKYLNFF